MKWFLVMWILNGNVYNGTDTHAELGKYNSLAECMAAMSKVAMTTPGLDPDTATRVSLSCYGRERP